jgi:hypothetical protein
MAGDKNKSVEKQISWIIAASGLNDQDKNFAPGYGATINYVLNQVSGTMDSEMKARLLQTPQFPT